MSLGLPIDDILDELIDTVRGHSAVVLQAPPGAGKTTRVPLALLASGIIDGKIIMLEPRRLAARAAAERMAQTLDEAAGQTVGYRMRGQSKVTKATRIEVVTEGILTRMLQDAPDLPGVGAVIFDEFHERSLSADLGLALCLEVIEALRDDLKLLVMSATLDAEPVAHLIGAPILTSEGRAHEVVPHWLKKPRPKTQRLETAVVDLTLEAVAEQVGSALVFLPGEAEIRRTEALLRPQVAEDVAVHTLFGAMDFKAQRAAVAPTRRGRKIVLATSIAETSLTIEGVRIVVDGGLSRRSEFDPSSGMSRLVTTRVSQAEATQRAGRAGRVEPGVCYKLWTRGEDGALPAFPPAEIEVGDLSDFALELALWGAQPDYLRFVTLPHAGRFAEAQTVLRMLSALDTQNRITDHGRSLASLPLHPRLAHMVTLGGKDAPLLAALLAERDILRGAPADLSLRIEAARRRSPTAHAPTLRKVKEEAQRLSQRVNPGDVNDMAALAALAYPDRVGLRRAGDEGRFVLSGGKGAMLPKDDPLAATRLLVATDLDGNPREARIRQAIALPLSTLREHFGSQIEWVNTCAWSRRDGKVLARRQERFGALVLDDQVWRDAPSNVIARAMLEGVQQLGLLPSDKALRLMARAALLHGTYPDFPDLSETTLLETLEDWLLPHLDGVKSASDWKSFDILQALELHLGWDNLQKLNAEVPAYFSTPLGRKVAIDYEGAQPRIALRLQEVFGVTEHPKVAGTPVQLTLLSPAQRPVQVTEDLPRFWTTSYADVRKDMRGRYPKHPWPEDPREADPTLRAKRRP